MAMQAYIIEDTFIVCSFAINMTPKKINRNPTPAPTRIKTIHIGEVKPYMTVDDKKLSDCFNCKVPAKIWGGFAALVAGIALGAAVVLTGGTVLLVIAVVAVAVTVAVPVIAAIVHDCDITLESEWIDYHPKVTIEGHKALLNQSSLMCKKGGILHLMLDEAQANAAMKQVFWRNLGETSLHVGTQFAVGFITGWAGAKSGAVNLGITATLAIGLESISMAAKIETNSVAQDGAKEFVNYGLSEGGSILTGTMISKVLTQNPAAIDATLDILVTIERTNPRLAYNLLDDIVKHITTYPATFRGAGAKHLSDLKGSLAAALIAAGISIGSNKWQRVIEGNTLIDLDSLNTLEQKNSSFGVMADKYEVI